MRYAILAAGEGARLAQEGIDVPKPLVRVGGEPLVDRLLRIFVAVGASEIVVVCNDLTDHVQHHLRQRAAKLPFPLHVVVQTTPSSMHSLYALSPCLQDEPFVLTTVDTVFRESEFAAYVDAFQRLLASGEADGLMGVTDYIDDEKPLYVSVDDDRRIRAFLDSDAHPHYVSAGIYGLTPAALLTLQACIARGDSRMRNFQRALLSDGLRLQAFPFTHVLDIDHAGDVEKAEQFLR